MTRLEPNATSAGRGMAAMRALLEPPLVHVALDDHGLAGLERRRRGAETGFVPLCVPRRERIDEHDDPQQAASVAAKVRMAQNWK